MARGSSSRMRPLLPDKETAETFALLGAGVLGAGIAFGGALYLFRTQILEGAPLRVRVEVDPEVKRIVRDYLPYVKRLSEHGLDQNVRLFPSSKTK